MRRHYYFFDRYLHKEIQVGKVQQSFSRAGKYGENPLPRLQITFIRFNLSNSSSQPQPPSTDTCRKIKEICRCVAFNDGLFSKLIIHPILFPRTFNVPCYVVSKKTARYDRCNKILHVKFKFKLRVKYFIFMLYS